MQSINYLTLLSILALVPQILASPFTNRCQLGAGIANTCPSGSICIPDPVAYCYEHAASCPGICKAIDIISDPNVCFPTCRAGTFCFKGTCHDLGPIGGGECSADRPCPDGQACAGGQCIDINTAFCRPGSCPSGYYCDLQANRCVRIPVVFPTRITTTVTVTVTTCTSPVTTLLSSSVPATPAPTPA